MREILFRGKRVDNGEWIEGFLFDDGFVESHRFFVGGIVIEDYKGTACDKYSITGSDYEEVIPRTVGQYIGKLDEYAVTIFEGDIIELENDGENYYIVSWDDDAAQYVLDGEEESLAFDYVSCAIMVVGNIFDNPDMADW